MKCILLLMLIVVGAACSKRGAQSYESDAPWDSRPWLMKIKNAIGPCGEGCSGVLFKAIWKQRTVYETGVRSGSSMQCNSISIVYDEDGEQLFTSGTEEYKAYLEGTFEKTRKLIWGCHLVK
ncbi:hypothetical protein [Niabella hibiscisoli]|uniref:hypothetical protein n=1 Tax=Niabella hibiscisoli TaxID=1825928 RepID=UPI001F0E9E05|nr:hypothetical protein [Niabella hibiscisoli]MCH5717607.1 hypothetical protein [Niabella hibiscisoli]